VEIIFSLLQSPAKPDYTRKAQHPLETTQRRWDMREAMAPNPVSAQQLCIVRARGCDSHQLISNSSSKCLR